jgi:hypothetical protein
MKTVQPIENERKSNQPMNDSFPLVLHKNQVCFLIELDRFSLFFLSSSKKSKQMIPNVRNDPFMKEGDD